MSEAIQRAGAWWQKGADDAWLRWNDAEKAWEPQAHAPPPPPPPGVAPVAMPGTPRPGIDLPAPARASARSRRMSVALVGVLAAVAVGVGAFVLAGDEEGPTPAAVADKVQAQAPPVDEQQPQSEEAFAPHLSALCRSAERQSKRLGQPQSLAELGPFLGRALKIGRGFTHGFDSLVEKAGLQATWAEYSELNHEAIALIVDARRALRAGDSYQASVFFEQIVALSDRGDEIAVELGVPACASDA